MKMKKLMTLGLIIPIFSITISCSKGAKKITFDDAFNFAIEHYDEYHHLGYEPTYILSIKEFGVEDTKIYKQIVDKGSRTYEQVYYIDTTIKDFVTTIDTDELTVPHVNSTSVREIARYLSMANAVLGYFDSYFTLEDNKYLGIYVGSEEFGQVFNIASGILAILGLLKFSESPLLSLFDFVTCKDACITLTAQCNNLGLFDYAHLFLEVNDLSFSMSDTGKAYIKEMIQADIDIGVGTSKSIVLDLEFIVDYSNKK